MLFPATSSSGGSPHSLLQGNRWAAAPLGPRPDRSGAREGRSNSIGTRSGEGRRTAGPAFEGMMKRGRTFVAEKPSYLRQRKARFVEILDCKAAPQVVDDLGEVRALLSEPPPKRPGAQRQRLRDDVSSSAAVRQQSLNLVLDRGPHRPFGRVALPRRLLAERTQCLEQMRIFCDERKSQGFVREYDPIRRRREFHRAAEEALEFVDVGRPAVSALDPSWAHV